MKNLSLYFLIACSFGLMMFSSCTNDPNDPSTKAQLILKFKFDPTQERLNNLGAPATIPAGHAAQSPNFNSISANYVELAPNAFTLPGEGEIVYQGAETNAGGDLAIDFDKAVIVAENEVFVSVPLEDVTPGKYDYIRVSLSYQNYDIDFTALGSDWTGTIGSFVGYNNYISSYMLKTKSVTVNSNKLQGYWGFEYSLGTIEGQAPEGATTVPNPLFASSPIPAGSCLVTGQFDGGFTVTGSEENDVTITLSVSTNGSFEYTDANGNGKYEPLDGDIPVDMGVRGLVPIVE